MSAPARRRLLGEHPLDAGHEVAVARLDAAAEALDARARAVDQVLVEVPLRLLAGLRGELAVQGIRGQAGNALLFEHRELHAVDRAAELGDVLVRARFLAAEVVGRKPEHDQSAVLVLPVERLEALVLIGVSALARGVHDQHHLALVLAERLRRAALHGRERVAQQRGTGFRRHRGRRHVDQRRRFRARERPVAMGGGCHPEQVEGGRHRVRPVCLDQGVEPWRGEGRDGDCCGKQRRDRGSTEGS